MRIFAMNSCMLFWWVPSAHSSEPARMPVCSPMISIWRWTTRLLSCTRSMGTVAMRCAISSTRASSSGSGNEALAQPSCAASTPLIESPVSIISIALRMPTNQAWKWLSGTPKRTAG